jgi:transcriptional regulator with PAS, ATPase and Fis domain
MGRSVSSLNVDGARRLKSYRWPGNVRELENVMERAVITATDGRLNLDRALPELMAQPIQADRTGEPVHGTIRTAKELEELERSNVLRALEATK